MGMLLKHYIEDDCLLGVWKIQEDLNTLSSMVKLDEPERATLNSFGNGKRKLEWLSVRVLINELTQKESKIIYNSHRKPFLADNSYNISISHSNKLTSILMSRNKKVGIDLEYMSHRISKIACKFINDEEVITSDPDNIKYHLYIHWCAKEALYKICDKQDINFKENLIIKPFKLADKGKLKGIVSNIHGVDEFDLTYFKYNNYVITWCVK